MKKLLLLIIIGFTGCITSITPCQRLIDQREDLINSHIRYKNDHTAQIRTVDSLINKYCFCDTTKPK